MNTTQIPRYLSHATKHLLERQKFHKVHPTDIFESYLSNSTKNLKSIHVFPDRKQKKKKNKKKKRISNSKRPRFRSIHVISPRPVESKFGATRMEWDKGSHGREIVPFSPLNFIMRGEIESRRSITRGSREIRFSRPPPHNNSHSRLAFSVSSKISPCGSASIPPPPVQADPYTKSWHVRSRRRCNLATMFRHVPPFENGSVKMVGEFLSELGEEFRTVRASERLDAWCDERVCV